MKNDKKVFICFAQPGINALFAELLKSRGISCEVTSSLKELPAETKIITEANFYPETSSISAADKLLIGTKNMISHLDGIKLAQPLSEECLENALSELLN